MKVNYVLISIVLTSLWNLDTYTGGHPSQKPSSINLAIIADKGGVTEVYDPTLQVFRDAINEEIPTIINPHIVRVFNGYTPMKDAQESWIASEKYIKDEIAQTTDPARIKYFETERTASLKSEFEDNMKRAVPWDSASKALADNNKWLIYLNQQKDWTVFIPKNYNKALADLGFNSGDLINIPNDQFVAQFADIHQPAALNTNNLKQLFDKESNIRKRIVLIGHGTYEDPNNPRRSERLIAQLNEDQYKSFLNFLNPTTDFLSIISCFSGGQHLAMFHESQMETMKEFFKLQDIYFPIAVSSTTERVTRMFPENALITFFSNIDTYLKSGNSQALKKAYAVFYSNEILNIPSIRFPGSQTFFRPIEAGDQFEIITATRLKAHGLGYTMAGKQLQPIIVKNKGAILLHPALVTTPIKIDMDPEAAVLKQGYESQKGTTFISMIGGPSIHVLEEVDAPLFSADQALQMFADPSRLSKTYVVKELKCKDGILKNVVVSSKEGQLTSAFYKISSWPVNKVLEGKWYEHKQGQPVGSGEIPRERAQQEIAAAINTSSPTPKAIKQATGGQQTAEILHDALKSLKF